MAVQSMGNGIDFMVEESGGTRSRKKRGGGKKQKLLKAQKLGKKTLSSIAAALNNGARIPREYWEPGCLFYGFADQEWLRMTDDIFPAKLRSDKHTHPCYVLESSPLVDIVCPCSSKPQRVPGTPYIPEGAVLQYTKTVCEMNSYVLKQFAYPMSPEEEFDTDACFKGFWPPEKLEHV